MALGTYRNSSSARVLSLENDFKIICEGVLEYKTIIIYPSTLTKTSEFCVAETLEDNTMIKLCVFEIIIYYNTFWGYNG